MKQAFGPQARLIVRGSAATGKKYNPEAGNYNNSKSFDGDSDYDFALVDKDLLEEIKGHKELGYLIREGIDGRTKPIKDKTLNSAKMLESRSLRRLKKLLDDIDQNSSQDFSVMIYSDIEQV